jgi:hypothetical protein
MDMIYGLCIRWFDDIDWHSEGLIVGGWQAAERRYPSLERE